MKLMQSKVLGWNLNFFFWAFIAFDWPRLTDSSDRTNFARKSPGDANIGWPPADFIPADRANEIWSNRFKNIFKINEREQKYFFN